MISSNYRTVQTSAWKPNGTSNAGFAPPPSSAQTTSTAPQVVLQPPAPPTPAVEQHLETPASPTKPAEAVGLQTMAAGSGASIGANPHSLTMGIDSASPGANAGPAPDLQYFNLMMKAMSGQPLPQDALGSLSTDQRNTLDEMRTQAMLAATGRVMKASQDLQKDLAYSVLHR